MYCGTAVAGRTRSRLNLTEKQDSEKKNQRKKRNGGEEFGSDFASKEEGCSMNSEFDDDVLFIGERDVAITVDDDDVLVVEDSDVDTMLDDDNEEDVLFAGEREEGIGRTKGVEDVERSESTGERDRAQFGLKRKEVDGKDIYTDSNIRRCIAERTRSHFSSKFDSKSGTFSNPLCVDDEEEEKAEFLSEQCDFGEDNVEINHSRRKTKGTKRKSGSCGGISNHIVDVNHDEFFNGICVSKSNGENASGDESEGLDCKKKAHKGKHARTQYKVNSKDFDAIKILQESLHGEEEVPLEKFASSSDEEGNPKVTETWLPLKFTFGSKVSKPPEKSEYEKELDVLWAEMDECLRASQDDSGQVENDHCYDACSEDEVSRATLCQQGKHLLTLNEEIGLTCRYCSHVSQEIKYYDPPFSKNPSGKSGRRDSCSLDNADHPVFNDLEHQFFGCDDNSSEFDPYISTGTVWDIIPGVKKSMFPHQCEAFEFLWTNLAGGIFLDKLKKHLDFASGSGCIISHAPGTGKTLLTIVFLLTFMKLYPNCRPMIIAPSNILLTWEEEFEKWKVGVPFHNLNKPEYSGKESEVAMSLLRQTRRHVHNTNSIRVVKLYSWKKHRSILGISYTLFERLARKSPDNIKKALLELPGLLVLDEGHTPRNAQSLIWKALSEVKTKRRIILSGTPFQNNFDELYNTLCLANPEFAEWKYLLDSYGKVESNSEKNKIVDEIRNVIKPFVHVHKGTVLQESLPGLRELVVRLKPTELQKEILEYIQETSKNHLQGKKGFSKRFKLEHLESLTAVHPSLFFVAEDKNLLERVRLNPEDGVKTMFLMELIRLSELMNEKVLVFSQYIAPLIFLTNQIKSHFNWIEGTEMLLIHGKFDVEKRRASIKAFNDPTNKVRILLASTRACFEGIDLVGASRVVLLDVLWNPSAERQAVSRAYRLGQKKVVYTYRLITSGSRDEQKCRRQAEKDQLSELVFFCPDGAGHQQNISSVDLEDKVLEKMVRNENFTDIFEKITTNKGVSFLLESFE